MVTSGPGRPPMPLLIQISRGRVRYAVRRMQTFGRSGFRPVSVRAVSDTVVRLAMQTESYWKPG
jgi:hypothetical protein